MQKVNSRLPDVGPSIFSVMSKMALEHGAINLSQGFPDFSIDPNLINLVHKYMMEGHNQYAPMPGIMALREVIASVAGKSYQRMFNPETEITITAGATEGLYSAISAFVGQGDEVIVFDPSYDSYDPAIRLNGGIPVHLNLTYPEFSPDWAQVRKHISPRTRMIIVNTPHNPSGSLLSMEGIIELENLANDFDFLVLGDEVYERIIFDRMKHVSVLSSEKLIERSIAVYSFGKTFHATGWKCGYVIAPEGLTAEIRKTHQFNVFSVNTPMQWALAEYMRDENHFLHLGEFYAEKRDFFLNQIKGSSFRPLQCLGSYFQLLSYEAISDKSDILMAEELTKTHKVASIPVSVFYKDKTDQRILRFCFAKTDETLEKAGAILQNL